MNRSRIILLLILPISLCFFLTWSLIKERDKFADLLKLNSEELATPDQENFAIENNLLVDYQEQPQEPYLHGPCPINSKIQKEIYKRCLPIGFEDELNKRQWKSIIESIEQEKSIDIFKQNLKSFILTLIKLQHPQAHQFMGVSERVDLLAFTRIAICDEIAILHFHVKEGIDPNIDEVYSKNSSIILPKQERTLFETFYKSCRMTATNSYRFDSSLFIRAAFYPTSQDWNLILKSLSIDPKRPNETVCTYKKILTN